jgi:hypothetical protein
VLKTTIAYIYLSVKPTIVDKYEDFCSICGFALTNDECAVNIEGTIIDFNKRAKGFINMTLCNECWGLVQGNHNKEMEGAKIKRVALELDNKSQESEKSLKDKWKERDGDGGVTVGIPPT